MEKEGGDRDSPDGGLASSFVSLLVNSAVGVGTAVVSEAETSSRTVRIGWRLR